MTRYFLGTKTDIFQAGFNEVTKQMLFSTPILTNFAAQKEREPKRIGHPKRQKRRLFAISGCINKQARTSVGATSP